MSPSLPLHYWSATELQQAYAAGSVTPNDATQACLDRIAQLDGVLHAFLSTEADAARTQAQTLTTEGGSPGHGLRGVPYSLKDNFDVAGSPTTGHSRLRADLPAEQDSPAYAALKAAQGIFLGKNSMHELATGGPSFDLQWPPARNPWDPSRHPAGSSSGSGAAVAAGMAYFSLGTDTGGSVRHPATACGIYGYKPAFGAISYDGVIPLAKSLDHPGVLARSVTDIADVMSVIGVHASDRAGYGRLVAAGAQRSLAGMTIGVIDAFSTELPADKEIMASFQDMRRALQEAGCRIVPVAVDSLDRYTEVARTLMAAEAYAYHGEQLDAHPEAFGARTRVRIGRGRDIATRDYILMRDRQRELRWQLEQALAQVDVALCLSSLYFPCRIDDEAEVDRTYDKQARTPFNLTGLPAISVPSGISAGGLPLGVQFAASSGGDCKLLEFAMALERDGLSRFVPPPEDAVRGPD